PQHSEALRYFDGFREVIARRDGDAVDLYFPSLGITNRAGGSAEAVVRLAEVEAPEATLEALGLLPVRALMPSVGLWLVRDAAGGDGLDAAARASAAGWPILYAHPDLAYPAQIHLGPEQPPNDPRFGGQWYLERIDILDAWALETGSETVSIEVVDTGCDLAHPDLAEKFDPGIDVAAGDDDPSYVPNTQGNAHGTAVAGLIAAVTDNGEGIAGTCPGCRLRCVRMLETGTATVRPSADIDAFQFALNTEADVVSNSWGFAEGVAVPKSLADAINEVHEKGRGGKGAVVVFAAGNDNHEVQDYELLAVPGILGVGATTQYDEATSFTNFGDYVDLVAPAGTLSTDISGPDGQDAGDYTSTFGGTSSACPIVAGVAGLVVSANPDLTGAEVHQLLMDTTRPAPYATVPGGHDPVYGYGIVDPPHALRAALGLPEPGADGGRPDAGEAADAGPAGGGDGAAPGCGCTGPHGGGRVPALALGILAVLRRRRSHGHGGRSS
ncbi:MAG: serine protease, partial [Deltaproteobacteria bacterium]